MMSVITFELLGTFGLILEDSHFFQYDIAEF